MEALSDLLVQHGVLLVFVNALLTHGGAPMPATPMLVLAGALVAQGDLALAPVLLAATAATVLGNLPWYYAGRRYGYSVLRTLCRISIEPDSCVHRTEEIFGRWGALSLVFGKYIPGFATIAPPLAGAMKLGFLRFLLYTTAGAFLWAIVPVLAGIVFHREVGWLLARLEDLGMGVVVLLAALVGLYIAVKSIERYLLIRVLRTTRIGVEELRAVQQGEEKPVVLDARSAIARQLEPRRIRGAIIVDIERPQGALAAVPPDREVVVYCS